MNPIFRYNPRAKYSPNGGQCLEILKAVDLFKQTIKINNGGQFIANLPNIFTHYPLGGMRITDRKWKNWENSPMNLW